MFEENALGGLHAWGYWLRAYWVVGHRQIENWGCSVVVAAYLRALRVRLRSLASRSA